MILPRAARRAAVTVLTLACVAAWPAARAAAQAAPPPAPPSVPDPGRAARFAREAFTLAGTPSNEAPRFSRPAPPLTPAQSERLRRAFDLRLQGLPDRARDTLGVLLREVPHHPLAVTELARVHVARGDWAAVVALGRDERLRGRDSLLVARELSSALERQGRPREAAQVVAEAWAASEREGTWAPQRLLQLAPADARGIGEVLRAASAARPARPELSFTYATLLARSGQPAEAARVLAAADRPVMRPAVRQRWADDALTQFATPDSVAAIEALVSLAADARFERVLRLNAARQAFGTATAHGTREGVAPRLATALADVPPSLWGGDFLVGVARTLRESGRAADARALLERDPAAALHVPELTLERLLAQLRDGPPAAVLPALDSLARRFPRATFMLAEAEFFAGAFDSALVHYDVVARDPASADALTALERWYRVDDGKSEPALLVVAQQAYARWKGDDSRARVLADSLFRALPRTSPLYAASALAASDARAAQKDLAGALAAALVVADSLAADRLAPLARQRAGELLLQKGDSRGALAQFEECLARYPRAWNAPEVRRRVERLRKDTRL
ncbi:MAG: hypothetical protein HZA61_07765 [Candidatus Eisenbacteria bacterium]|uniref:Tetratricopeptide repeat protein n=1 Tax=Eiseniibacteriota bacterium TaxID=2212470 RepID=A0A933SBB1_UNCEI|nr:hypothetical protein [Candidatus Eisenbacteria bacterium]